MIWYAYTHCIVTQVTTDATYQENRLAKLLRQLNALPGQGENDHEEQDEQEEEDPDGDDEAQVSSLLLVAPYTRMLIFSCLG